MKKYRIKEYDYGENGKSYVVQKKSILGFWYNPDNCDAYTTGVYDTLEEAKQILRRKLTKIKTRIVCYSCENRLIDVSSCAKK